MKVYDKTKYVFIPLNEDQVVWFKKLNDLFEAGIGVQVTKGELARKAFESYYDFLASRFPEEAKEIEKIKGDKK